MEVAQNSNGNSKKTVEEGPESSCREVTDAGPCELIHLRKSDGCSAGPRDVKKDACGKSKSYKPKRNRNKDNILGSLSYIDDAELSSYLNTKEEFNLKRILWEAMNGKCTKAKKQKRTTETKKGVTVKKDAEITEKLEVERRSSRINYDALKLLNDELDQNSETAEIVGAGSCVRRTENSPHGNISHRRHGSENSSYNEDEHDDMSYCEDNQTYDQDEMYNGYGDQHLSDEHIDFW